MTDAAFIARHFSATSALMLLLLRQRLTGVRDILDIERFLQEFPVSPETFAERLSAHNLTSVLYPWIRDVPTLKNLDTDLARAAGFQAKSNLASLAEMMRLQGIFEASFQQVIFIKGVLLSRLLFGDFTSRSTADIDILVRADDFIEVRDLLLGDGYEELYPFTENYPSYYMKHNREAVFRKVLAGGIRQYVEIQWSPTPKFFPMPYGNDYFFAQRVMEPIGDVSIPSIPPTQHLLMLFIHHGVGDLWRNLRHVYDIAMFIARKEQEIDWKELHARAKAWHMQRHVNCGLSLAADLFYPAAARYVNEDMATAILDQCKKYLLDYPLLPKKKIHWLNLEQQLRLCDSDTDRISLLLGYLQRYLAPGMEELSFVKLPPALFPLYYPLRRFRFLYRRKTSGQA